MNIYLQKGKVNMSLCKEIQYLILHNKKLDWLKREKEWKLDRIDGIFWVVFLSTFLLAYLFGEFFVFLGMFVVYLGGIIGHVRHIKSIPGDIESSLMSPMICIGMIFFSTSFVIAISVALGRLL